MNFKDIAEKDIAAFVWIWLPDSSTPVVAGKLTKQDSNLVFNYGQSYLTRENKISIFDKELPLQAGELPLLDGLSIPGCIRDGSPDAWGRRVILNKKFGFSKASKDSDQIDELTYLLESGSDRIGALDFQRSATEYIPRQMESVTLAELLTSAEKVENGIALTQELDLALHHGTAIGGARPKALIDTDDKKYIAKFSSTSDLYNVIKLEFLAMRLAKLSGINVAEVVLKKSSHKDVLLIERFDRIRIKNNWHRKHMISALTLFEFDEMMARYASYENLAEIIRFRFSDPAKTLKELFQRLVFNILVGNTDDHARNHAAFYDGEFFNLTPAYDICPQPRSGNIASQAMFIYDNNNQSQLINCIRSAKNFLLTKETAVEIIEHQLKSILKNWTSVCELAKINQVDEKIFKSRQFLNPFIFENLPDDYKFLEKYLEQFKKIN